MWNNDRKLKILVLVSDFWRKFPKHKQKYDMIKTFELFADIRYWHNKGNITEILRILNFKPDFIFHYDIAWGHTFAPKITGLDQIDIPKGCFVIDLHYPEERRIQYIEENNIDLIFSVTKYAFLERFPQFTEKHRWLPWSINTSVIKDRGLKKDTNFLLMGQFHVKYPEFRPNRNPPKGTYPFREAVLERMKDLPGFVFHPHPGHDAPPTKDLITDKKYAKELNRAKMFFTCGGANHLPVLKFFEALGCKTLLLAEPNPDILELGFQDRIHFVACNTSDFFEKAMYYAYNKKERESIANNGYKLIHTYHTNHIRAQQFVSYIREFLEPNKFGNSFILLDNRR